MSAVLGSENSDGQLDLSLFGLRDRNTDFTSYDVTSRLNGRIRIRRLTGYRPRVERALLVKARASATNVRIEEFAQRQLVFLHLKVHHRKAVAFL